MGTFAPILGTTYLYNCFYDSYFNTSSRLYNLYPYNSTSIRVYGQNANTTNLFNPTHTNVTQLGLSSYRLVYTIPQVSADGSQVFFNAFMITAFSTWTTVNAFLITNSSNVPICYLHFGGASVNASLDVWFTGPASSSSPYTILVFNLLYDQNRNTQAIQEAL